MSEIVVVWDGRKDSPSGPYLFAQRSPVVEQPRPVQRLTFWGEYTTRARQTRRTLTGWFTTGDMAEAMRVDKGTASSVIQACLRRGEMAQEFDTSNGVRRDVRQRYRWVKA